MKLWEKTDSLEDFMRRQERLIKQNEFYKKLIIIPVIMIAVSISVIAYNFTAGHQQSTGKQQKNDTVIKTGEPLGEISAEKINLNTATADMLDFLPGIGSKKADAIIEIRDKMGGFHSVEDILNVDGIGEKILAEIQNMIYVETE